MYIPHAKRYAFFSDSDSDHDGLSNKADTIIAIVLFTLFFLFVAGCFCFVCLKIRPRTPKRQRGGGCCGRRPRTDATEMRRPGRISRLDRRENRSGLRVEEDVEAPKPAVVVGKVWQSENPPAYQY